MLNQFLNYICCRTQQTPPPPPPQNQTMVCYQGNGVPFLTEIQGGPGGILNLTDEEWVMLVKEIDIKMYTGEKLGELTPDQITHSIAFNKILRDRNSVLATPSSGSFTVKVTNS